MKKVCFFIVAAMLNFAVFSDVFAKNSDQQLPPNCTPTNVKFVAGNITFLGKGQRIFFIKNVTQNELVLNHTKENPGAGAGWASTLRPSNWSALALNRKTFNLTCVESKPGAEQVIGCEKLVKVCESKDAQFDEENAGTYWIAENLGMHDLLNQVASRGIKLSH